MHILVTGGTGFIGAELCRLLRDDGHQVTVLTRQSLPDTAGLRYVLSLQDISSAETIHAVVNLAGESLAQQRWTPGYKRRLLASRLDTTGAVLQLLQRLEHKPEVLISASAIGYYGHHGDEVLDEAGASTPGFAQDLCEQWEQLAMTAQQLGVRVCLLRLGVVLDRNAGAFVQMARPFKFGVANWMGSGRQWLSWVHRKDVIAAVQFLLRRTDLSGPFNVTAEQPVTSREFGAALKRHMRTWITLPVPARLLRLLLGEMADELLLQGQRVIPAALVQAGFEFSYPDVDSALVDIVRGSHQVA